MFILTLGVFCLLASSSCNRGNTFSRLGQGNEPMQSRQNLQGSGKEAKFELTENFPVYRKNNLETLSIGRNRIEIEEMMGAPEEQFGRRQRISLGLQETRIRRGFGHRLRMEFDILQVSQRALALCEHSIGKPSCSIDSGPCRRKNNRSGGMKRKSTAFRAVLFWLLKHKLKQTDFCQKLRRP